MAKLRFHSGILAADEATLRSTSAPACAAQPELEYPWMGLQGATQEDMRQTIATIGRGPTLSCELGQYVCSQRD